MLRKNLGTLVITVFSALVMSLPVQNVFGQATTRPPADSTSSTATQTPKPRPPTSKDVAEIKAAFGDHLAGSPLNFVVVVGNYTYAAASVCHTTNSTLLASYESGKWMYLIGDAGSYTAPEMVKIVPEMPLAVAKELQKQAWPGRVYWPGNNQEDQWEKNAQVYDKYRCDGDDAGAQGDFDEAIAAWTKAATIDVGDLVICRKEYEQVSIRAATDAKARTEQRRLTKQLAEAWYWYRLDELWKDTACTD